MSERNHSPTEDRAVACPGRGVARPISIKRQTLSCLPLLDPQVGGREHIKPPCPVRSNDLLQAREAFMLPSMLKGYRQLLPRPLGTTRDHSQHSWPRADQSLAAIPPASSIQLLPAYSTTSVLTSSLPLQALSTSNVECLALPSLLLSALTYSQTLLSLLPSAAASANIPQRLLTPSTQHTGHWS